MRTRNASRWLAAAGTLLLSTVAAAQVRISEFHYDNTGADTGEQVEVSAPAGTDLTGWRVVLYNGSGGASYATLNLAGIVPATCDARGVVVVPAAGMQNGPPDGLALVAPGDVLVEFLSYEGLFAATNGPAAGITATDVGVSETGTEPVGLSLARDAAGVWSGPAANTFGACNDNGTTPPPAEVASVSVSPVSSSVNVGATVALSATAFDIASAPIANTPFMWSSANVAVATVSPSGVVTGVAEGDTLIIATAANGVAGSSAIHVNPAAPPPTGDFRITEIHYDNSGTDAGEAIEIEGPAGADITGFSLVLYNGDVASGAPYNTQVLSGVLPASCGARGVFVVSYPSNGIQNGSPDGMALVSSSGALIEFLSYEGTFTGVGGAANDIQSTDIGASQTNADPGTSLQRDASNVWRASTSTFGACNPEAPPPPPSTILITGRTASDPALPVGYEDQLFGQLRRDGATIPTTFSWTSETPDIMSIGPNGVMRALGVGTAILRATAADGTTATIALPTRVAVASGVTYPGNAEFGEPADGDPGDDLIVRHEQFTASYNPNRGTPNWVSYDLDAAHFGPEDRCDCFTMDPDLPATLPQISTDDYTNAGAFAGYGIDRGHMTRSFDRTTGSLDNARTYLFSNVVPQASDLNQGPWAILENELGDFARFQDREVYVVTGVAGKKGTLKDQGRVVIPTSTWKVAVIMAHDAGLADIRDYRDLEVIAVNMPNDPGVRNNDWRMYLTTVDAIEALSGYDLLSLLPDEVEAAVESGTQPPIVSATGPTAIDEGATAAFDAAASLDPNGSIVSYSWNFGDGSVGEGSAPSHTYLEDGTYAVTVTATDDEGLTGSMTIPLTVNNVAPVFAGFPDATRAVGESYALATTFVDPGADAWSATVTWGDGSTSQQSLDTRALSFSHVYSTAGTYTVNVTVSDGDAATTTTHLVTVVAPAPGLDTALTLVDQLVAARKLTPAVGSLFRTQIVAAQRLIARGNQPAAAVILKALVVQIDLLVRLRQVSAADVAPLRALLVQLIEKWGHS